MPSELTRGRVVELPLKTWKAKLIMFAGTLGAPGLLLISFLDSSILSFPIINDLLLIQLSMNNSLRMPLYAAMAMIGSVLGCVVLYYIAKKGGEAGQRGKAIRHWVEQNGFGGMLLAALLPPPTPFKVFVFAAGVFEVPVWSFTSAISLARALRYFGIGYLAIRYGNDALPFLFRHKWQVTLGALLFAGLSYMASRLLLRERKAAIPAE
jgi:membrane protein YqaA with SNARE-associated domain